MEDYELYVSSQFEHAQTALALAAENVQREADRRVIVAGIVVTVINIVVSVYLRGRP